MSCREIVGGQGLQYSPINARTPFNLRPGHDGRLEDIRIQNISGFRINHRLTLTR